MGARTWTVQAITLQGGKPRQVSAFVSGAWAIHWTSDGCGTGWRLTHVPTGYMAPLTTTDKLVNNDNGPEQLQRLVDLLDKSADWSETPDDHTAIARRAAKEWLGEATP